MFQFARNNAMRRELGCGNIEPLSVNCTDTPQVGPTDCHPASRATPRRRGQFYGRAQSVRVSASWQRQSSACSKNAPFRHRVDGGRSVSTRHAAILGAMTGRARRHAPPRATLKKPPTSMARSTGRHVGTEWHGNKSHIFIQNNRTRDGATQRRRVAAYRTPCSAAPPGGIPNPFLIRYVNFPAGQFTQPSERSPNQAA